MLRRDSEIYCTPVSENRLNVSILGSKKAVAAFARPEQLPKLLAEIERTVGFRGVLAASPLGAVGLGGVRRRSFHQGAVLVGDCCESMDPIGGMGMTHALISSHLASEALLRVIGAEQAEQNAFSAYQAQRKKVMRPLRGMTRLTAVMLRMTPNRQLLNFLSQSRLPALLREAASPAWQEKSFGLSLSRFVIGLTGR
jgi:flavin-dependent dehydrogenase